MCIYPAIRLQALALPVPPPRRTQRHHNGLTTFRWSHVVVLLSLQTPSPRAQLTQPALAPPLLDRETRRGCSAQHLSCAYLRDGGGYWKVFAMLPWLTAPMLTLVPCLVAGATCLRLDGHLPGVGVEILAFHQGNASFALTARDLHGPALPSCTLTLHFGLQDAFLRETLSSNDVPR